MIYLHVLYLLSDLELQKPLLGDKMEQFYFNLFQYYNVTVGVIGHIVVIGEAKNAYMIYMHVLYVLSD